MRRKPVSNKKRMAAIPFGCSPSASALRSASPSLPISILFVDFHAELTRVFH
jgi:hypothetical protein